MDCHASRDALARNDGLSALFTRLKITHNDEISLNFLPKNSKEFTKFHKIYKFFQIWNKINKFLAIMPNRFSKKHWF